MTDQEPLLTVPEVAAHLRVDEETVRVWLREGSLGGFRLAGRTAGWRVRQSDLVDFIQRLDAETVNQREGRAQREARAARAAAKREAAGRPPITRRNQTPFTTTNPKPEPEQESER